MSILFVVKDHEGKGAGHPEWSLTRADAPAGSWTIGQAKVAYITHLLGGGSRVATSGPLRSPFKASPGSEDAEDASISWAVTSSEARRFHSCFLIGSLVLGPNLVRGVYSFPKIGLQRYLRYRHTWYRTLSADLNSDGLLPGFKNRVS